MNPNDFYNEFLKEHTKRMEQIMGALNPYKQLKEAIIASTPKIVFPEVEIPRFEFPKFKLPEIDFPELEINDENIEAITEYNSSHGWTLTGEMDIVFYLDEKLLLLNQYKLDDLFVDYYESDSKKNYLITKTTIFDGIDEQWKSVLNDCFELYEQDKYKVIIPMLISIIEGEISKIADSVMVGRRLFEDWEKQIISEKQKVELIINHTLYQYLSKDLFGSKKFIEERGSMLNRHWVLHGRDNPDYWTKADALKLINVLSTLQFIKD
jgi:hypothetical protein